MLESNQRPPPCKLGQSFPGGFCPVRKSRLSNRFLAFLAPSFSCSVRMCPALVAAWLQHLSLLRPAPYSPTLSRSGSALWSMVLLFVGVWRERARLRVLAAGDSTHAAVGSLGPGLRWFPPTSVLGNSYSPFRMLMR